MNSNKGCGIGGIIFVVLVILGLVIFKNFWKVILIGSGAVVIIVVVIILISSKKDKQIKEDRSIASGGLSEKITAYRKMLSELMHYYYNLHDKEVKTLLKKIEKATNKMINTIKQDPRDADTAGRFIRTSLDGAKRIMDNYKRLEKAPEGSEQIDNAKSEAEKSLKKIIEAFKHQNQKLYENDIMSMDVETEVLNKTIDEQWTAKNDKE